MRVDWSVSSWFVSRTLTHTLNGGAPPYLTFTVLKLRCICTCSFVHKGVVDVLRLYPHSSWAQLTPVLT